MWTENKIFHEDLEQIAASEFIPWNDFHNKRILVTGATGLIGFSLISALMYVSKTRNMPLQVIALVRDLEKAEERFKEILAQQLPLTFVVGDLENLPFMQDPVDYIIHGGGPTSSRYFAQHPVETVQTNLVGATGLLELAKKDKVKGIVFLSSMEVYGTLHRQEKVDESHESFLDTMIPRNSYPEVKRMVESLFTSYASEYGVPASVIRLTQTFGVGVRDNDNRVFAQFMRSALNGNDIVLVTTGGTRRCYLYTADAVTAILTVLLKGKSGEAYNAANEGTYCSIREMADMVAGLSLLEKKIQVKLNLDNKSDIYPPELYMNLDTQKLRQLGWQPTRGMEEMFERMILTR